ncbi:transcription termination factor Rho [Rhodopirellula sp. MGV]|uniref:transcription termination factor Rho n=1 Tax=Rhodopirellula sp. MGV TaxID=2023130 RepID=UPI000B97AFF4|nr:transcription termination factor Rho [Rhodopirellula sp. MGV]OYP31177.1 transcription termination factor Rho [Rhodopirellula sp. MGV]PNY36065.1 transcription termination factor Rho [Rhodopirellula baltica]
MHKRHSNSRGFTNRRGRPVQRHPDKVVDQRIRELDAERDPLSLPEEIVSEATKVGKRVGIPSGDDGPQLSLAELQAMPESELHELATSEGIENPDDITKQELIFAILKNRMKAGGLMYGEGTLEILPDGFGFLRSSKHHYVSCPDDIYVSPSQIRRFGLQTGSHVAGQIRPPKENERYFALLRIEAINRRDPSQRNAAIPFEELTPLHPDRRIMMEHSVEELSTRIVDMLTPIGFGQRGLIVSPPRAGKTILMQNMARAVLHNYPEAYVFILLIDERPEEVTDMEREVRGPQCEVISSTFDEPAQRHIQVAQMVIEKAKRMVESGIDVVVFLDSITRLARAHNSDGESTGKLLTGGLDAGAMQKPKAIFGSARKTEEGGSLTILATALVDTGSKMDDVIFEEFKGTGNLEIVLDRGLVERRIWPAIDISRSGTRREEMLLDKDEYQRISALRRAMVEVSPSEAMGDLVKRLSKTQNNAEFLMSVKDVD